MTADDITSGLDAATPNGPAAAVLHGEILDADLRRVRRDAAAALFRATKQPPASGTRLVRRAPRHMLFRTRWMDTFSHSISERRADGRCRGVCDRACSIWRRSVVFPTNRFASTPPCTGTC